MRTSVVLTLAVVIGMSARADDKSEAEAHFKRGVEFSSKKEYDKAIDAFTDAIKLDPKYAAAYFNRGNEYLGSRKVDKAIADYTDSVSRRNQ